MLSNARDEFEATMARLREIVVCLLDVSFRGATLSSQYGHTFADNMEFDELPLGVLSRVDLYS